MPGGRPTKYTPELLEKCHKYIEEWRTLGDMIPSHNALSLYLDVSRETLYAWEKDEDKKEFSDILSKIMVLQQSELINKGLEGKFSAPITKLVLGKHGYSDKVDTDVTTKGKAIKNEWHVHPVTTNAKD